MRNKTKNKSDKLKERKYLWRQKIAKIKEKNLN